MIDDAAQDPVLAHVRALGLANRPEDTVKVVYHPEFVSPVSPLWGMDYEQFVRGCHLGVFPSSYEPWGYTPLECVAMGVPSITSDLAGFGRYVSEVYPDHDDWGLLVLQRRDRGFHDAASDLTRRVLAFCRLDRHARIALRNEVEAHSRAFDWARLGSAYHEAHDLALEACSLRLRDPAQRVRIEHRKRAPSYFQFEPAPVRVFQEGKALTVDAHTVSARVEAVLYDFGAISVGYAVPFEGSSPAPSTRASRCARTRRCGWRRSSMRWAMRRASPPSPA